MIRFIKINSNYIILLISSIIPFLILGPFVPDLIISVASIIFLIYVIKNNNFFFFNKKPLIIFFLFCLYCTLLSIFVAKDLILSLKSSLFYCRFGFFACVIFYLIEQNKKILNYFYYALFFSFLALVIDAYIQFFFGYNLLGYPFEYRLSSFFKDELILGSYLSRLYPLFFSLFIIKKKKKNFEIFFSGILFILIDVLIFVSGERTAFFFLNLSTFFIIVLANKYGKMRLILFILSIIFIIIIISNSDDIKSRMINYTSQQIGLEENSKKINIFSPEHESLFLTAYNMFRDQPVFGHGPKMFRIICQDEKYAEGVMNCNTHPHNFYIQLLAETGVIGFMFLLSVLIYVIYCSVRQLKSIIFKDKRYLTDYQVCLLSCILVTVWPLAPNGNFFNNWLVICYSLPVGFYLHSLYGKNRKNIFF